MHNQTGPPVMAATARVHAGTLPVPELGAYPQERGVGKLRARGRADGRADGHSVEAVDHRREVALASGDAELRDVGDPQPVWLVGREAVPVPLVRAGVLGRLGDLARVRFEPVLPPRRADDRPTLPHALAHDPLAGIEAGNVVHLRQQASVAVGAAALLERGGDGLSDICVNG